MTLLAFASREPLAPNELESASVHYPRPSRLGAPLKLDGTKAAQAADALGLHTVGDLLEHLPRDRREARAVAELVPGESATVVVPGAEHHVQIGAPAGHAPAGRGHRRR